MHEASHILAQKSGMTTANIEQEVIYFLRYCYQPVLPLYRLRFFRHCIYSGIVSFLPEVTSFLSQYVRCTIHVLSGYEKDVSDNEGKSNYSIPAFLLQTVSLCFLSIPLVQNLRPYHAHENVKQYSR